MSKRVLIITYYWPPSAGSGVQRWLKFAKYLPEFGWEPVIFTPENPDFALQDPTLLKEVDEKMEVMKFPIWEPYGLFRKMKSEQLKDPAKIMGKKKKSFLDLIGIWLRANVLVPDPRVFWVKPSVNFLTDLAQQGQFDVVITTGPPHSLHLIGRNLKRKTGITWFADFRDPWSQWELLDTLPMTSIIRNQHNRLEKTVLKEADAVMTVSPTFQKDMVQLVQRPIHLLTNGFDPSDLPLDFFHSKPDPDFIEIVYSGVIDAIRNPAPFLIALRDVFENSDKRIKMRFVGKVSETIQELIERDKWLKSHVTLEGYVSHESVFGFYQKAHLLLLVLTDTKNAIGNIPGKLFEYMATGRPILALGDPQGDTARILQKASAGTVIAHSHLEEIKQYLMDFEPLSEYKLSESVIGYSRIKLTEQLANLLNEKCHPLS